MKKLFLIARSNIRKAKGQAISIFVLILLASLMLNLWLMLSMDYKANFDRYHDKLNAEHVTITIDDENGEVRDFLAQTLDYDKRVSQYLLSDCMHMTGTFPYHDGEMNSWFVFMEKQAALTMSVGRVEMIEEGQFTSGVYLPMLYKTGNIQIGNSLEFTIGSHTVKYMVCGFFNSIMVGSNNCGMTQIILSEDQYVELKALNYAPKATLCSLRIHDPSENVNYEAELKSIISKKFPNTNMISNSYDMVIQARYISQGIYSGVMSAMAFFVLLIALVVIISNILNYIQVNMKNLGALKAVGYTSKQLILSLILQFLSLTFLAAIVGVGLSYCLFPSINLMMISQTGIPYVIHFLPLPILISFLILESTVALAVWIFASKIKKIEPIVALRAGVQTHNFKRNHVPLEHSKIPLNFALALKTTLSIVKHNITVCITMFVLSLIVVFSGVMTANIIVDTTPFVNLIVGETADSCISVSVEVEDAFIKELEEDTRVEKAYLYTTISVTHFGGAELLMTICNDFSMVNNPEVLYKGRFPKYENEIAIGAKYAKEKRIEIGNEISITANGKTEKFLICGLTQVTNYLGRDGLLTRQGYERLGTMAHVSYYLNVVNGTDIDELNAQIKEKFVGNVNTVINVAAVLDASLIVYVSLMKIIVIAILFLSSVILHLYYIYWFVQC